MKVGHLGSRERKSSDLVIKCLYNRESVPGEEIRQTAGRLHARDQEILEKLLNFQVFVVVVLSPEGMF